MKYRYSAGFLLFVLVALSACTNNTPDKKDLTAPTLADLIPKPVEVKTGEGFFRLEKNTVIRVAPGQQALQNLGEYLANILSPATGTTLKMENGAVSKNAIALSIVNEPTLGQEGYQLNVTKDSVVISASSPAGIFYGIQTIRQLLPASIEKGEPQNDEWLIATGTIRDYPEYAIRGAMLDVARHFFEVKDVRRYIDLLAYYKMNTLHLHLSDDQGWRIEIKKWPRLTEYGSTTEVGGGKGGFYTQEQYKELVQYAADRFITIIPEIDMPGHTNAALASYPELNCNEKDKSPKLYTGTEVGFSTLCTRNEKVYGFVKDVLDELAAITPGPYLHIGGDESHVTKKEDYIFFMNRVQAIAKATGKNVIGWDEIALSTLQPNTIAQFWADSLNSKKAVQQGAKIMMSPASRVYMDMQYDSTTRVGLHWAGYIEVDKAYNWNPATFVGGITRKDIAGVIAPLWTETLDNIDDVEYMMFPRFPGYAEIAWTPAEGRSWDEYKLRLGKHGVRMKAMGIDYYPSKLVDWKQ